LEVRLSWGTFAPCAERLRNLLISDFDLPNTAIAGTIGCMFHSYFVQVPTSRSDRQTIQHNRSASNEMVCISFRPHRTDARQNPPVPSPFSKGSEPVGLVLNGYHTPFRGKLQVSFQKIRFSSPLFPKHLQFSFFCNKKSTGLRPVLFVSFSAQQQPQPLPQPLPKLPLLLPFPQQQNRMMMRMMIHRQPPPPQPLLL